MEQLKETIVYHFDDRTGAYVGSGTAIVGPAGDVQIPAFATTQPAPDVPDGHVARLTSNAAGDEAWIAVQDWRHADLYRTVDGKPYVVGQPVDDLAWDGLGELPAALTTVAPPGRFYAWSNGTWSFDLSAARDAAVADINLERDRRQIAPFEYGGHRFNADANAIANIASATMLASIAKQHEQPYSIDWSTADGAEVTLDADGVIALAAALNGHIANLHATARDLKAAIGAATSQAELTAIVWPA
ncbi:DUF4376 domain-containing protein [Burkholderia cenocepacia]|uniref:DUF4376 domain-containing protein n=1 Tax=Burkholderia cenocepacia TaxID=95486 RepID=UPI002AB75D4E|nr:DUF4376 domain-containing protein [Burkholderia cenocepacia]